MLLTAVVGCLTFLGRSIGISLASRITTVRKVDAASVARVSVLVVGFLRLRHLRPPDALQPASRSVAHWIHELHSSNLRETRCGIRASSSRSDTVDFQGLSSDDPTSSSPLRLGLITLTSSWNTSRSGRDLDELKELPVDELADHLVMYIDRL